MKKVKLCIPLLIVSVSLIAAGRSFGQLRPATANRSLEVKMPATKPAIASNYLNTVTTTAADGKRYKLIIIGDVLPRLFVNDKQVSSTQLTRYSDIIEKLKPILLQRQRQAQQ
jgi:hypothetical protein